MDTDTARFLEMFTIEGERRFEPVYRMPGRDAERVACTLKAGDNITYQRVVARVGYEFGVHSVTRLEWAEVGVKIVSQETGLSPQAVKRVLVTLNLSSPFKGIKHQIYEALIYPLIVQSKTQDVRAMWFYDCSHPRTGHVDKVVRRRTGVRSLGGRERYGPYLSDPMSHQLYQVFDNQLGRKVFVHPLDSLG